MKQIHITTGDQNGIGLETTLRALLEIPIDIDENRQYVLWREASMPSFLEGYFQKINQKFNRLECENFQSSYSSNSNLIDIRSKENPVKWVEKVIHLCLQNPQTMAMVTGPLSKTSISQYYTDCKGHTDLLRKISKCQTLSMCFLGEKFNVLLLTDHQPFCSVKITKELIIGAVQTLVSSSIFNDQNLVSKPLGVLGLNPHAGEEGLLGREEKEIFQPLIQELNKKYKNKIRFEGPLVPDVAFQPRYWKNYSFYLCAYHDQGLIPFKMIHEHTGVHLTLGLPFIRTSVDHGTAKDLFGKNEASFVSMKKAIEQASFMLDK